MRKETLDVVHFDHWEVGDGREPRRWVTFTFSIPRIYLSVFLPCRMSKDILYAQAGVPTASVDYSNITLHRFLSFSVSLPFISLTYCPRITSPK